jgi:hypothetical protein
VLCAVAADAEIGGVVFGVVFLPDVFGGIPAFGDGIAEEEKVDVSFFGAFKEGFV